MGKSKDHGDEASVFLIYTRGEASQLIPQAYPAKYPIQHSPTGETDTKLA